MSDIFILNIFSQSVACLFIFLMVTWWWTGRSGVLQSVGSELNWTELMGRRILFLWNLIYQYFILWIVLSLFPLRNFCLCCWDVFLSFLLIVCHFYNFYAPFRTSFELKEVEVSYKYVYNSNTHNNKLLKMGRILEQILHKWIIKSRSAKDIRKVIRKMQISITCCIVQTR